MRSLTRRMSILAERDIPRPFPDLLLHRRTTTPRAAREPAVPAEEATLAKKQRRAPAPVPERVIGYIRVSTSDQANEGVSLDAQRAKLEAWCAMQGAVLVRASPDEVLEAVLDVDARLAADVEAGREAIRRLLRGGTIRLRPTPERVYVAEADVVPLALFLATDVKAPAAGDRYTTDDCGGRI